MQLIIEGQIFLQFSHVHLSQLISEHIRAKEIYQEIVARMAVGSADL